MRFSASYAPGEMSYAPGDRRFFLFYPLTRGEIYAIVQRLGRSAGIAQLVEQLICNQQVGGSSPSTSSIVRGGLLRSASGAAESCTSAPRLFLFQIETTSLGFDLRTRVGPAALGSDLSNGGEDAKMNMGEFPSGQRGQTVNLLAMPSVVRIHLPPPKRNGDRDTVTVPWRY